MCYLKTLLTNLSLFQKKIKEHEESLNFSNPRDFIDYFLIKIEKVKCDPLSLWVVCVIHGLDLFFPVKLRY